jgi:hypothetical protein
VPAIRINLRVPCTVGNPRGVLTAIWAFAGCGNLVNGLNPVMGYRTASREAWNLRKRDVTGGVQSQEGRRLPAVANEETSGPINSLSRVSQGASNFTSKCPLNVR